MNSTDRPRIDYTNKDYASLLDALLGLATEKLPAWTDHSPNDLGVVLLELFSAMGDIMLYYQDQIANESYLATAQERRSVINLLRLIGYEMRPPAPATADLSLYFADTATGLVQIDPNVDGQRAEFQAKPGSQAINFQYVGRPLTIDLSQIPATTAYQGKLWKLYETLPVTQVDSQASGETLGSSDGSPNQRYSLALAPLTGDSLVVTIDEGAGPKAWQQVDTLLYSQGADEHYIVQRDEQDLAWVIFGDGKYGKIPARGVNNLAATYRTAGGIKGNAPANTITRIIQFPNPDLSIVLNRLPATGGAEREDTAEAALRGPKLFRAMGRAVTAGDYETQAMEFGVGKARARAASWNRIELYVAPSGGGQPTDTLKEDLRSYFDTRRILTSLLDILDPLYVAVSIEGTLEVEPYFFADQVQQNVQDAVSSLLAFDNVDFEDVLYISKIYEAVESTPGVAGVNITRFSRPDSPQALPSDGTLRFGWNEIPLSAYPEGLRLTSVHGGRHGR